MVGGGGRAEHVVIVGIETVQFVPVRPDVAGAGAGHASD